MMHTVLHKSADAGSLLRLLLGGSLVRPVAHRGRLSRPTLTLARRMAPRTPAGGGGGSTPRRVVWSVSHTLLGENSTRGPLR